MKKRRQVFHEYYTEKDFEDISRKLPAIIADGERKILENMEPTIFEQRKVHETIMKYVRDNKKIVYGGTATNAWIESKDPKRAIYDEYTIKDIDVYSSNPRADMIDLCNLLYKSGFKNVQAKEGRHEDTYIVYVNFREYCNLSYAPKKIESSFKTSVINEVIYVHPHFIMIDQLRIFNNPTGALAFWEKNIERFYLLSKYFPFEHFDSKKMKFDKIDDDMYDFIVDNLLKNEEMIECCVLTGLMVYKMMLNVVNETRKHDTSHAKMNSNEMRELREMEIDLPFIEIISTKFFSTVKLIYSVLISRYDHEKITIMEFFPLFQYLKYEVMFMYNGKPIIKVYDSECNCIPTMRTKGGMFVTPYQYILMFFLMNKFKYHMEQYDKRVKEYDTKQMYYNYSSLISNVIKMRNIYLAKVKDSVINNSIFGEFKISCMGISISSLRESIIRRNRKNRRQTFGYNPEAHFQKKGFLLNPDEIKASYPNISGGRNDKDKKFIIENMEIIHNEVAFDEDRSEGSETETQKSSIDEKEGFPISEISEASETSEEEQNTSQSSEYNFGGEENNFVDENNSDDTLLSTTDSITIIPSEEISHQSSEEKEEITSS